MWVKILNSNKVRRIDVGWRIIYMTLIALVKWCIRQPPFFLYFTASKTFEKFFIRINPTAQLNISQNGLS